MIKYIIEQVICGFFDEHNRLWLRGRINEPYFNIEGALHAKFNIGKTATLKNNEKISDREIKNTISFEKISEIKYVNKIPVDKRHKTKVDYNELKKILKIEG